jgi:hypothetical protein
LSVLLMTASNAAARWSADWLASIHAPQSAARAGKEVIPVPAGTAAANKRAASATRLALDSDDLINRATPPLPDAV